MKPNIALSLLLCLPLMAMAQEPQKQLSQQQPPRPPHHQRPQEDLVQPFVHDPVVMQCDGVWYLFATGFGVDILSSTDCIKWNRAGHVLKTPPQWAIKMVPGYRGHTWAPDIAYHNGLYYLYYSCSTFGKNTSAIGVATNRTLDPSSKDYRWEDQGCVIRSVGGRDNWNAIDPNLIIDEQGEPWLSFGSFWDGIKLVRLDSTLTRPAEPQEWYPLCRRPKGTVVDTSESDDAIKADRRGKDFDPGNGAVEAPFIIHKDGYYYLFVSYDLCCRGPKSTYKVVVGRSSKISGPYVDANGTPLMQGGGTIVVQGNDRFPGVGHCAVTNISRNSISDNGTSKNSSQNKDSDGNDSWQMFFHAYDRDHGYNSILLVRPIDWSPEGWPTVNL